MKVASDLTFSVSAPNGATATGTVRSEGSHIVVETTDPRTLVEGLLGQSPMPTGFTRTVGRRLHREGLHITVAGPRGTIASVGAGVIDPIGRLLTGSWRVHLGRPAALLPLVGYQLRALRSKARKISS